MLKMGIFSKFVEAQIDKRKTYVRVWLNDRREGERIVSKANNVSQEKIYRINKKNTSFGVVELINDRI